MTSMLEYQRHKERFQKELFRRIGYTNTLYQIFRFGQIIKETHHLYPVSQTVIVKRIQELHPNLSDLKYATGVIDVLSAFNIVKRVGQRVALTYHGRALAAVAQQNWYENVRRPLFLKLALEADGDYLLNLLSLIPGAEADSDSGRTVGVAFFQKILEMIELRKQQLASAISTKFVREVAIKQLEAAHDSIRYDILNERRPSQSLRLGERLKRHRSGKLKNARGENEPTQTIRHTIDPRRGWLVDLGLILRADNRNYQLTPAGSRLLQLIQNDGFSLNGTFCVPFSTTLAQALEISDVASIPDDYFDQLGVMVYYPNSPPQYSPSAKEFLEDLRFFFGLTQVKGFNQSEILALYHCMVLKATNDGRRLSFAAFQEKLKEVLASYSDQVYQVAGRYGQEGYLSFRRGRHAQD